MTEADADAVAEIRVRGWRTAYAGLLPGGHLDALDAAEDAARRRERLAAGDARVADLVAESAEGDVVGWVCFGPCRDADQQADTAELYALYLRPERIGTGVGRSLCAAAVEGTRKRGYARMSLWVVRDNARARRFYERAGFAPDGAEDVYDADGTPVPEVRYVLDPLRTP